jgi:hypothetical protein
MYGQTDSIDLEGLNEKGEAPKRRLSDPTKAFETVQELIRANAQRARADTQVKSQLDGSPPFDPVALRKNAQANRTNINFLEGEGIHNAAVSPYYDLFSESPWYCEIQTDYGSEHDRVAWSKVITEEHDRMLKDWDKFDFTVKRIISDRTDYGKGFAMWPDDETWRADPVSQSMVLVPDQTDASIDENLELIVVRQNFTVSKLWTYVQDGRAAKAAGWNRPKVIKEMFYATADGQKSTNEADIYQWYQQKLRNNDLSESVQSKTVQAAHLLVREFDGKITHLIVGENATPQRTAGETKKHEFMFERVGQYENMRQALAAFFYDIGDGKWHSIKGLLKKLYPFIALKDRLNCATIDNAFLNMTILVKAQTKEALNDLQMLRVGTMSIIPPGLNLEQHQVVGRMEESLVVERHLDNKLSTNIGQYRQTVQKEKGNPETATKVMADQSKEAMLGKSAVNGFYSDLDFFYEETYRRSSNPKLRKGSPANNAALEFQQRCIDRGVPKEAITKVRSVRAYRNIGNGSIFMRQAAFQSGMVLVPMLNEEGRNNFLDDAIATNFSQDMVSRYNPKPKDMYSTQDQMNLATLENSALRQGNMPMVTPTQNHVVHGDVHLKFAHDAAMSLQEGGNPMDVLSTLEAVGPHVGQHLAQFQNDPTRQRQFKALEATWKKLAIFTEQLKKKIQQDIQKQAMQRQQQNGAMTEEQLKQQKAQSDIQRKDAKAQVDMRLKEQKAQQSLAITGRKAEQSEAIADVTTAADLQRQQAKAEADAEAAKKKVAVAPKKK